MQVQAHVLTSYPALESCVDALEEFFAAYGDAQPHIAATLNQASGGVSLQLQAHVGSEQSAQLLAEELASFAVGPTAVVATQDSKVPCENVSRKIFKVPNGFEHLVQ